MWALSLNLAENENLEKVLDISVDHNLVFTIMNLIMTYYHSNLILKIGYYVNHCTVNEQDLEYCVSSILIVKFMILTILLILFRLLYRLFKISRYQGSLVEEMNFVITVFQLLNYYSICSYLCFWNTCSTLSSWRQVSQIIVSLIMVGSLQKFLCF